MKSSIKRVGASLSIQIPESVAQQAQLTEDTLVDVVAENGRLIVMPLGKNGVDLNELLSRVTDANLHGEIDILR
jgi:antitoxin MazE